MYIIIKRSTLINLPVTFALSSFLFLGCAFARMTGTCHKADDIHEEFYEDSYLETYVPQEQETDMYEFETVTTQLSPSKKIYGTNSHKKAPP